nr:unnamed protein product [Spirometra erinaceieuropaei]
MRQVHKDTTTRVTENSAVSEATAVTNRVKQSGVLAPSYFSLIFSAMIMDAHRDERLGIRADYRTDGQVLNCQQMHFHSRVSATSARELLFADDFTLYATIEGGMQRSMDLTVAACDNFGPIINTEKTVVMNQPSPGAA